MRVNMRNLFLIFSITILMDCKKESSDYRDKVIGRYKCIHMYSYYDMDTNYSKKNIDTLIISKINDSEIQIMPNYFPNNPNSFTLNSKWTYIWRNGDGNTDNGVKFEFFPNNDSISYITHNGGMGGNARNSLNGIKIK